MSAYLKLNLRAAWLMAGMLCLTLPVFLPSLPNSQIFLTNVVGTATVTMFIMSFPASLLDLPLMFFAGVFFGFDPNTIGGMYQNLLVLFGLGLAQWFWVVPRFYKKGPRIQTLNLSQDAAEILLPETRDAESFGFYDRETRTPVERVIRDED